MDSTSASVHGASDVLRSIPRPEYPIQVFTGAPPAFSLEAQREVMRWSHERGHFLPDPNWVNGPNIKGIKETVWPFLQRFGCKPDDEIPITFLADGGFNRVYGIQTPVRSYVFRVAFPVDPYYKTEADVATSELVRHFTTIPVPKIYAYDSSTQNGLGLEWILMDRITSGEGLHYSWEAMEFGTKVRLAEMAADWSAQLANITSSKIGSVYMRRVDNELEFFIGRCVSNLFTQENRLLYDVSRGPFESLQDYYTALLTIAKLDVEEATLAYKAESFRFEEKDSRFKGTFLDQSVFFFLDDPYEKPDEELLKDRMVELELLATGIGSLQAALPELCAKAESPREMVTMLAHGDLSQWNIFVDDNGNPVAVLDWENIKLAPLLFLTRPPVFIDSAEDLHEPEHKDVESLERIDPGERAKYVKDNEEWYAEHLNDYQCTMLRQVYHERLKSLGSQLANAVADNFPEFERELLDHVVCFSWQAEDHVEWVDTQLSEETKAAETDTSEEEEEGGASKGALI
ncbi:MAG: hypothetical protein ASARMPRED_008370 [Alectoria sarmentosa]|nr:MAG: hypothetical protein ASARMPRED_008370 [Alectoria sarmentosa]